MEQAISRKRNSYEKVQKPGNWRNRKKIFNLILLTVIVLTVLFVIFSTSQSKMLSALTSETSVRQQQTTSGIISDTMTQVTQISMESITDMEAQIVDEMFQDTGSPCIGCITVRAVPRHDPGALRHLQYRRGSG